MRTEDWQHGKYWEVTAGEDLSALSGSLVTIGADNRAYRWDPASDTNHILAFCVNAPKQDGIALLVLPDQIVIAVCQGGATAQDRMMPSSAGNIGKAERWSVGNPTCGFALANAVSGDPFPMLFQHYPNA